jgi:ribosomal protein S18 acetylase RimI-like enzyme
MIDMKQADHVIEIRDLSTADAAEVAAVGYLFDEMPELTASQRFAAAPGHHLLVAFLDDRGVGFVSGVEMTHPDKGTEMFLYELGVDEPARRRGVGTALVQALARRAHSLGCYGMWALTDADNEPARRTYRAGQCDEETEGEVMLSWTFVSPRR